MPLRLEIDEEEEVRFVELRVEGASHIVRAGGLGRTTTEQTVSFLDEADARAALDARVRQKLAEGWVVGRGEEEDEEGARLRRAISPDDRASVLVYGDWLEERGDPHGELIAVQCRLEDSRADDALVARERELLGAQAKWLTRGFDRRLLLAWRRGFVDAIDVPNDPHGRGPRRDRDLRALLELPIARTCRRLVLRPAGRHTNDDLVRAVVDARPPFLSELRLFDFAPGVDTMLSWTELGDIGPLLAALPSLERLFLQVGRFVLTHVELPNLVDLTIRTTSLSSQTARAIANAWWPSLERLELWIGTWDADLARLYQRETVTIATLEDLGPILEGQAMPRLAHLALRNTELTDDLCAALARAPLLARLRTLDLSSGTMTSRGAATILAHAAAFAHLERLDVTASYLEAAEVEALKRVCAGVVSAEQRVVEDDGARYVAVAE